MQTLENFLMKLLSNLQTFKFQKILSQMYFK